MRLVALVLGIPGAIAGIAAAVVSPVIVVPPLAAATLVLITAALVVDYFGIARRREGWAGFASDPHTAWTRARALRRRFDREHRAGSPRTAWTARSLLVALAECDRLADSRAVVDFLGIDAVYTRVGSDSTADALRAIALAELGRAGEARELLAALGETRRPSAVVDFAAARVAELDGRPRDALALARRGLERGRPKPGARRDLRIVEARALAHIGRAHDATAALATLVSRGWRRQVEDLAERSAERGDTATSRAARQALSEASPYR